LKKGNDRFPPDEYRVKTQDLLPETEPTSSNAKKMSFDDQKKARDQQFEANQDLGYHNEEEEDPDEECDNEVQKSIADMPAKILFKKKNKCDAKLEDFKLLRIVGKGTFGKVY